MYNLYEALTIRQKPVDEFTMEYVATISFHQSTRSSIHMLTADYEEIIKRDTSKMLVQGVKRILYGDIQNQILKLRQEMHYRLHDYECNNMLSQIDSICDAVHNSREED